GVEQLFAILGGTGVGGEISIAAGTGEHDSFVYERAKPADGDDERGFADVVGVERVWTAGGGAEFVAGSCVGTGAFRFRVPDLRGAVDVQASDAGGLFPHDRGCERNRSGLVLAGMVFLG